MQEMTKAELVMVNTNLLRDCTTLRNQLSCVPRWVRWVCAFLRGRLGHYYGN